MTTFQIGGPVTDTFVDREKEIELIMKGIHKNNYALIGLRRTGKTSLALRIGEELEKGMIVVYIDASYLTPLSEASFLKVLMKEIMEAYSNKTKELQLSLRFRGFLEGAKESLIELLKSSHVSIRDTVEIWFKTSEKEDLTAMVKAAFEMPEKLAKERKVEFLIILDEFTRLLELKNDDFIWALRSHIHRSKLTHYIISGSAISTIRYLLEGKKSPFYGTLVSINIEGLDDKGVDELLAKLGKEVTIEAKEYLKEITGSFPLYLQAFCYLLSIEKIRKVTKQRIEGLIPEVFKFLTPHFEHFFVNISGFKKDILIQMAVNDILSAAELAEIFNKTPSYINSYLRRLTNEGLLGHDKGGKYRFTDNFFKLWVKKNAVM